MKSSCWLLQTVLCCIIKMMDGLCPNLYFSACGIYTTWCQEFTQKYQYSPNNMMIDFMNLSNWMFLSTNCSLWVVFTVCFTNFLVSPELKWAPCCPFHPHFDMLAVNKQIMCKTCTVEGCFVSWGISLMHTKWELILYPLKGLFSETGLFNKKSRTPVLRPLISFVVSWTRRSNVTLRRSNIMPRVWHKGP